jgi:DNA-binding CsgD family transcriptional regulator
LFRFDRIWDFMSLKSIALVFEQFKSIVHMAATLCIQIQSANCQSKQEVEFYHAEEWTADTEVHLIQQMHALLTMIRPMGKALQLTLYIEVTDELSAISQIRKKLKSGIEINTQKLSVREIEIIGLLMQGLTNNEIAEKLFICFETVKSHRKNILMKTGAKNTAELINYYHQTFFEK